MLNEMLTNVRRTAPRIHSITNYVTANDCANILLACGASPIMADDVNEVEEITALCDGLNLNMGTPHEGRIESMVKAGKRANLLGHPVILDPVGMGASRMRTQMAYRLLHEVHFSAIRGNISEIKALASGHNTFTGVDADVADTITEESLPQATAFAKRFS